MASSARNPNHGPATTGSGSSASVPGGASSTPPAPSAGSFRAFGNSSGPPVPSSGSFHAPVSSFTPPTRSGSSFHGLGTGANQLPPNGGSFHNLSGSFTNLSQQPAQRQGSFTYTGGAGALGSGFAGGLVPPPRQPGYSGSFREEGHTQPPELGAPLAPGHSPVEHSNSKVDCQDQQCAEEECDPEQCGDEKRGPRDDNYTCGIDRRPLLPVLLVGSTLTGAFHNMVLEFPLLRDLFDGAYYIRGFFLVVYILTIVCMTVCLLFDPGQLTREQHSAAYAELRQGVGVDEKAGPSEEELPLPRRAHKSWLYHSPVRRYDHFCRWLTNCIGLLNHREFITMVCGLVTIGVCGSFADFVLIFAAFFEGHSWTEVWLLLLHFLYSLAVALLAGPIFRLHVGFICRNELANEWKRNDFYVVTSLRTGRKVPVNDLSDDEFNERFDCFEYDKSRNPWDADDAVANCLTFWCTPRWPPGQLGEF